MRMQRGRLFGVKLQDCEASAFLGSLKNGAAEAVNHRLALQGLQFSQLHRVEDPDDLGRACDSRKVHGEATEAEQGV